MRRTLAEKEVKRKSHKEKLACSNLVLTCSLCSTLYYECTPCSSLCHKSPAFHCSNKCTWQSAEFLKNSLIVRTCRLYLLLCHLYHCHQEKPTSDSFRKKSGRSLLQTHFNDISLVGTKLPFNLKEVLRQEEALHDYDLLPVNAADYH